MARLTCRLEGDRADNGFVRAREFAVFLDALVLALKRLEDERELPPQLYRIVDLSIGSATIELDAASEAPSTADASALVIEGLLVGVAALEDGALHQLPFRRETLEAFINMTRPLRGHVRSMRFATETRTVTLTRRHAAVDLPEPEVDEVVVGSFSGYVDALNVHAAPVFYIYPASGPGRVRCEFEPSLLDNLREAIKRHTTVNGTIEYHRGDAFPHRIVVDRVQVNPPSDSLPSLRALYGRFSKLTNGLDSVTFVRQQRDATP